MPLRTRIKTGTRQNSNGAAGLRVIAPHGNFRMRSVATCHGRDKVAAAPKRHIPVPHRQRQRVCRDEADDADEVGGAVLSVN